MTVCKTSNFKPFFFFKFVIQSGLEFDNDKPQWANQNIKNKQENMMFVLATKVKMWLHE